MYENACPHCKRNSLRPAADILYFQSDKPSGWKTRKCSACGKVAVWKDDHLVYPNPGPTTPPDAARYTRREPRRVLGPAYLCAQVAEGKTMHGYFADAGDEGIGMKTLEPFFLPIGTEVELSTITNDDVHSVLVMRAQVRHSAGFRHGFRIANERSLKFFEPSWQELLPPEPM